MAAFATVGNVNELQDGQMKAVTVDNREILLARVSGKYYAAEGRCPHMGGRLWQGKLEGTVVTCPVHGSRFDLTDGHVVRWTDWTGIKLALAKRIRRPRSLRVYPVNIDGDKVIIAIGEKATTAAAR